MVWYAHLFKSFPQFVMIHTVKGFSVVNETERDVFLELPCFLYDPVNVGSSIFGSSVFSKPNLDIWKFLVGIMLKLSMQDFKHDLTSMRDEWNCPMVWTFLTTALLGNWHEDWPFPVLWSLLGLPDLLKYWVQHFNSIIFRVLNSSTGIPFHPLALFTAVLCKAHLTSHYRKSEFIRIYLLLYSIHGP